MSIHPDTPPPAGPRITPHAYIRADNKYVILVNGTDQHIRELPAAPFATVPIDLSASSASAVAAAGRPMGYLRFDGLDAVVYRGTDHHVHELLGEPTAVDSDLTTVSHTAVGAADDPMPYVRSDRKSTVVYRGTDDHVHELALTTGAPTPWLDRDLSVAGAAPVSAVGVAMGYVRSDAHTVVVYLGTDGHIHEIDHVESTPNDADLLQDIGETTLAATAPWGFQRTSGLNTVVYVGIDAHVHELFLTTSTNSWVHEDVTAAANPSGVPASSAAPSGYLRWNEQGAIVYVGRDDSELHELIDDGVQTWHDNSLYHFEATVTTPPKALVSGGVFGTRASSMVNSVVHFGTDGHIYEHRLPTGGIWETVAY